MDISVLKFIQIIRNSFIGADKVYTNGSCYQFYKILKSVFPQAKGYYNVDHVITEINGKYYDITGEVKRDNHLLIDEHFSHKKLNKLKFKIEIFDEEIIAEMKEKLKLK
jgi:hypothetical protein